jgi:hypothetical protein
MKANAAVVPDDEEATPICTGEHARVRAEALQAVRILILIMGFICEGIDEGGGGENEKKRPNKTKSQQNAQRNCERRVNLLSSSFSSSVSTPPPSRIVQNRCLYERDDRM